MNNCYKHINFLTAKAIVRAFKSFLRGILGVGQKFLKIYCHQKIVSKIHQKLLSGFQPKCFSNEQF